MLPANREKPFPGPVGVQDYGFDGETAQQQRWRILEGQFTPGYDAGHETGIVNWPSDMLELYNYRQGMLQAIPGEVPKFNTENDEALSYASNYDDWFSVHQIPSTPQAPSNSAWNRFLRFLRG